MKNAFKFSGIVAVVMAVGLSVSACNNSPEEEQDTGIVPKELRGTWKDPEDNSRTRIISTSNFIHTDTNANINLSSTITSIEALENMRTDDGFNLAFPRGYKFTGVYTAHFDPDSIGTQTVRIILFSVNDEKKAWFGSDGQNSSLPPYNIWIKQ